MNMDMLAEMNYASRDPQFFDEDEAYRIELEEKASRYEIEWDDNDPTVLEQSLEDAYNLMDECEEYGANYDDLEYQVYKAKKEHGTIQTNIVWHRGLPSESGDYLVYFTFDSINTLCYSSKHKRWNVHDNDTNMDTAIECVKYWAYYPKELKK